MRKLTAVSTSAVLGLSLLAGCGGKIKPKGPVLTPYERARDFAKTDFSPAKYSLSLPPFSDAPVLPFMAFGMPFDIDIAIGLKDDDWDMLEFARFQTPEGPQWLVLESRADTLDQVLLSNHENTELWLPELPLERKRTNLVVTDRTTSDGIDIEVQYDNSNNEPVTAVLQGDPPDKYAKKRNGNTQGHSANSLLALIDISSAESLFKGEVRINDRKIPNSKVAGIVPMRFALTQTQGGLAAGSYQQIPTKMVPFERGAELMNPTKWEPPAPPPPPPAIPAPANVPTEEDGVVLLPMAEWASLKADDRKAALEAQEAKAESCLIGATTIDPDYEGLAVADFFVQGGKAWQITIAAESTANELVMSCLSEMVSAYTFDEELEGAIRIEVATFKADHEAANDLEKAWLEAHPTEKPADEDKLEDDEKLEDGDLPEEDLLGEDPDVEEEEDLVPTGAAPLADFDTLHTMANGEKVLQGWTVRRSGGRVFVSQDSDLRTLTYEFLVHGEDSVLELRNIRVDAWGGTVPAFNMTFSPALPDMRRAFGGRAISKFVMDVNGQQNVATGEVAATFGDGGAKLIVTPTAPDWAASRPMISNITFKDRMATVNTRRSE